MNRLTRSRIIVVLLFIVAFGAGLSVGKTFHRPPPPPLERGPSWLSGELNLTPQQRQDMLNIWDQFNHSSSDEGGSRRELQKQRNEAITQLVPADKQEAFKAINDNYSKQMSQLSDSRHERFEEAMTKTKAVLTPPQREKYERILARRENERRGGPGRGERTGSRGERGNRPEHAARPATTGPSPAPQTAPAITQPDDAAD